MAKPKYDWQKIKQEYITANLTLGGDKELSLKELAEKYKIDKNVLWNKASKGGWKKELKNARKLKDDELSQKVYKLALEVDEGKLLDEYRVRTENYETASQIMKPLLKRFKELTPKKFSKLSTSNLIKGINTCLKAKADAAGLPKEFQQSKSTINYLEGEIPIEESQNRFAWYSKLAKDLRAELDNKNSDPQS